VALQHVSELAGFAEGEIEPQEKPAPAPPCAVVIFGAGGDLTARLLMPALYNLSVSGLLDRQFSVIGVDRVDFDDTALRARYRDHLEHFVAERRGAGGGVVLDREKWEWLESRISYLRGDFDDPATYAELGSRVAGLNATFYLAVAARFFGPIVDRLGQAGLASEDEGHFRRVIVEKPFGSDLASARALNRRLLATLDEGQIYRIDHYLGKETVQNILALRFSNGIFEPLWSRQNIDHIQITAAETVGVEKRAGFYEQTGAMRDMVPNHLMQLLAMTAMEAPTSFDADAVRDEKSKVLAAIHPMQFGVEFPPTIRGQYGEGEVNGEARQAYRAEPGVSSTSTTETFAAMKLQIDNWRWAGVPFYLRTGKRLAVRRTEIAIHFKQAPYALFRSTPVEKLTPNIMVMHIQPREGVTLQFSAKQPGPVVDLGAVRMSFDYADFFEEGPSTGYETLIYDCLIGDATLFQRADNVEAGWRAVQPALDAVEGGESQVHLYPAGSGGPREAAALLARDGRRWLRLAR
jgi:glucose-6-phosphate 1-dehydrogenase